MIAVTLGIASPTSVRAQTCAGMPASSAGIFAGGQFEQDPQWGGELGVTSPGRLGIRGQYLWEPPVDDPSIENEAHRGSVLGTISVESGSLELCPGLGLELEARVRTPGNLEVWSVPVGVGLGLEIPLSDAVSLSPFVFPQAVYVTGRPQFEEVLEDGFRRFVRTDDAEAVDARLDFGAVIAMGRFYASVATRMQTQFEVPEGTRTVFERPLLLTVGRVF